MSEERFFNKVSAGSAWWRRAQAGAGNQAGSRSILALDPGYRVGWAIIALPGKNVLAAGFTELNRNHLFFGASKMVGELIDIFNPVAVVFEQYFIGGGAFAGDSIELRGAMKCCAESANLPWANVSVSRIRSILGLRSRRTDSMVRQAVLGLMPDLPTHYRPTDTGREKFYPADVWDAIALAWAADTVEGI